MKGIAALSKALVCTLTLLSLLSGTAAFAQQGRDQIVRLDTSKGPIVIRVFYSMVPYTAGNFLDLVDSGFYNGLSFHRVENWVIQGGDPNGNGSGHFVDPASGQTRFIRLETHPALNHNQAGTVAMARSQDRNSASCQFYITKSPMAQLNGQYAVFGRVLEGMNAVYAIRRGDRIISATIVQAQSPARASSNSGTNAYESTEAPVDSSGKPKESGF